jgi:hypothetical protein
MSQEHDAERRFLKTLFGDTADDQRAGDYDDQGASEYTDEQRKWAKHLFATLDDEDSPTLAGLTGKIIGRWRHSSTNE